MEIDLIFKIAAVGIVVSILNQVLVRSGREEQATMTSLAALVVVLMIVVQKIAALFDLVKDLFQVLMEIWKFAAFAIIVCAALRRAEAAWGRTGISAGIGWLRGAAADGDDGAHAGDDVPPAAG